MINQTAKKILKALSFDGVEVEAFRHMADLKRLDPMKIFYKKVDEKIYNGSHAVPVRIFFPNEKSFRESEEKKADSQERKLLLFIHGGGWVTESIDNYERICARLADATGQYVVSVEYRLAPEDKFPAGLEDCYAVAKALYSGSDCIKCKAGKHYTDWRQRRRKPLCCIIFDGKRPKRVYAEQTNFNLSCYV